LSGVFLLAAHWRLRQSFSQGRPGPWARRHCLWHYFARRPRRLGRRLRDHPVKIENAETTPATFLIGPLRVLSLALFSLGAGFPEHDTANSTSADVQCRRP